MAEMFELVFAGAALAIAGVSKGLVGMGLPPIAMGLLVLVMSPVEAASTMVVPALLTNVWQGLRGPALRLLLGRFWPMLALTGAATLVFADALATHADLAIAILGGLLMLYGAYSLASSDITLTKTTERWAGPISGALTGVVTAFTGVSSMPSVPFLRAVGLNRDALVQAMGLSFSVSALALMAALGLSGGFAGGFAGGSPVGIGVATVCAFVGMAAGTSLRRRLNEALFRRVLLCVLIALGGYLLVR